MGLSTKNAGGLAGPSAPDKDGMVDVKITTGTVVDGNRVSPGDVVKVNANTGRQLLAWKKAEPHVGKAKKPATRKPRTRKKKAD